jgi:FtsK/SpoIIIE family/Meiotically up-regulated gene 113
MPEAKKKRPPNPRLYWIADGALTTLALWWLGRATWHQPDAPWRIYQWGTLLTIVGALAWLKTSKQRKRPYGDKAAAFWIWHWFTGARLIVVDNPDLPWWQDVRKCWPFLDTTPSEPCPCGKGRFPCLARRAATGLARTALTAGLVLGEYVRSGAPHGYGPRAVATWGLGGTAALCLFAITTAWLTIQAAMWLWWIHPLHCALTVGDSLLAGWDVNKRPRSWIKITRTWENGRGVRVKLPLWFKQHQENKDKTLQATLNVCEFDPAKVNHEFKLGGSHSTLVITPAQTMPAAVSFANETVRAMALDDATRWAPVFGVSHGWAPVAKSINSDSPHILITGPSGQGKSVALRSVLFQLLWHNRDHNPTVVMLDPKVLSHPELEDLSILDYVRDLDAIARRLIKLQTEMKDRADKALAYQRQHGRLPQFDPIFVVFEDINSAMDTMAAQGSSALHKKAVKAWRALLNMGRALHIHVIACPQRPEAGALGGGTPRSCFGIIILLGGYARGTWNMVAPDLEFQELERKRGLAMVISGDCTPTQLMWDERDEMVPMLYETFGGPRVSPPARGESAVSSNGHHSRHATQPATVPDDAGVMAASPQPQPTSIPPAAGARVHPPSGPFATTNSLAPETHPPSHSRSYDPRVRVGGMGSGGVDGDVPPGPDLVTLREAYGRRPEFFGVQYDSVKRARRRDKKAGRWPVETVVEGNTDDGESDQYHYPTVLRWWQNRPRSDRNRAKVEWVVYSIVPGGPTAVRVGGDVKVGYTGNIEERVKTLAERLEHVVKLEHFPTKAEAYRREQELHREFWRQRKHRDDPSYEVFTIEGPVARYLADRLVTEEVPA